MKREIVSLKKGDITMRTVLNFEEVEGFLPDLIPVFVDEGFDEYESELYCKPIEIPEEYKGEFHFIRSLFSTDEDETVFYVKADDIIEAAIRCPEEVKNKVLAKLKDRYKDLIEGLTREALDDGLIDYEVCKETGFTLWSGDQKTLDRLGL